MIPINSVPSALMSNLSAGVEPATSANSKPVDSAEQQKLKKAGSDFESILLASMWKSMKQSFGDNDDGDTDPAKGTIDDWGIEAMSGAVGKAGGLGIGNMIIKHLSDKTGGETTEKQASGANVFGKLADRKL
jgi:Rod binding domain-containing protein